MGSRVRSLGLGCRGVGGFWDFILCLFLSRVFWFSVVMGIF